MVKPIKFTQPPKIKGQAMVRWTQKFSPIDRIIVEEFAARMSEISGIKVAPSNVLMTTFYQRWPDEAKKKLRLEKEAKYGRKYIDGIKSR
jgi:hypothetical protein